MNLLGTCWLWTNAQPNLQAFASQFVYCRNKLGLDPEKINVNGGAIAIGHPLGTTGMFLTRISVNQHLKFFKILMS